MLEISFSKSFLSQTFKSFLSQKCDSINWQIFEIINLQVTPELYVDTARGEKLRINVDIIFSKLPCVCKYFFQF